jgi:NADH-quinone oxidoreductase subunit L
VFGFAGFYSKDAIIEAAYANGTGMGTFAFWSGAVVALLTSFYSWRLMFLTFWGKPRWAESEHIQHAVHEGHGDSEHDNPPSQEMADQGEPRHVPSIQEADGTGGYHPHESPWTMLVPLIVLSLGAVFAGFIFYGPFIDGASFWNGAIAYNEHLIHAMEEIPGWAKWSASIAMAIGFVIAWVGYIRDTSLPQRIAEQLGPIYTFVYNKWYFDELYNFVFVRGAFWFGRLFWHGGDEGIIDRFGPNGSAWVIDRGSILNRRFQSGYLTNYALIMLVGLVAAVSWVMAQ